MQLQEEKRRELVAQKQYCSSALALVVGGRCLISVRGRGGWWKVGV